MKHFIAFIFCCLVIQPVIACTTFCINKNGQIVFGRNYDWVTGGGIANTNLRGLFKTSLNNGTETVAVWISMYGSISFNQYGKEFPTGGMNEKGLVVELMWLDGTVYPAADKRPAVGVLQWIQYQLDNSSTVDELISSDANIRISDKAAPIHYLVADAKGNVATVEFLHGKMIVHKDKELPFPVLTNNTYESSTQVANRAIENPNMAIADNSLDRFVKACGMVKQFKETNIKTPIIDYSFSILDKVAQGNFTKWSIVYDITKKEIHFKTESNKDIKTIRFASFGFSCNQSYKMYNMNQDAKGDISSSFTVPDKKIKESVMNKVITESSDRVNISADEKKQLLEYEHTVTCKQ